ncbi:PadR family transcriptional regulator [Paradesulfitobacterium aromaticivorans]
MIQKQARHTAAFLLLFLAEAPAYGHQLLGKMQTELPYFLGDSSGVYRSLQEIEEKGWAQTRWDTEGSGQPRKWYYLTAEGIAALADCAEDITKRQANLEFFLKRFQESL